MHIFSFRLISLLLVFNFFPSFLGAEIISLSQKDFEMGTYLINRPGYYQLSEDILFNPNSPKSLKTDAYNSTFLKKPQYSSKGGRYDDKNYGLGFFAAIAIFADDVTLDLNGHTIEQSLEHALLQRFFAVIELANQPFIPSQGPHNFGEQLKSARRIVIKNGKIGRSAHHGIHGNGNHDVRIDNVQFHDFEVAAVALNGVDGLEISNCTASSRKDVAILGTFSSARFIQPYLEYLVETGSKTTLNVGGNVRITASQAKERLQKAINAVHQDLIVHEKPTIDPRYHPEEYALFHNASRVIDGNCYGFLVNAFGQAVDGFPVQSRHLPEELAKNIRIRDVHIKRLEGKVNEIIALNNDGKAMVDPVGAVFQINNTHPDSGRPLTISNISDPDARYVGNLVANAQALVAKAHLNGDFNGSPLDLTRSNITKEVIDWIEAPASSSTSKLSSFVRSERDFLCNADSMFHVNKGVIAFKIDAANHVSLENSSATNVVNYSEVGSEMCSMYKISHPKATLLGCGGPKARAYSFSGSSNVRVNQCTARNITARCGSAIGFDILTDSSNIVIRDSLAGNIFAGKDFKRNKGPNDNPEAIGFCVGSIAKDVSLINICGENLEGRGGHYPVMDESHRAKVLLKCNLAEKS